ncbi:MAG: hypothetical protein JWO71_2811 [Candidatus Acidoferrum typicum]|nr:hypothetical protein [Candidatus Acidoferrum typicum]
MSPTSYQTAPPREFILAKSLCSLRPDPQPLLIYRVKLIWNEFFALVAVGRQPFHNRAPSSRIRLDANAIIDG